MNVNWKNFIVGLAVAVFFSLLYFLGVFNRLGYQSYDLLLRFRAERDRVQTDYVVFLDVDDNAIAYNGIFPWPRSITADALLRLKEFGATAAIFDIEYIDRGPPGVDAIYLNQGLSADFNRSFDEINASVREIIEAIASGRLNRGQIEEYSRMLHQIIDAEHYNLFSRAQRVARDNDLYLVQSSALFGRSWASLNLRESPLTDEEQIGRRPMAEELFSYPIVAPPRTAQAAYVDILPTIPGFAQAAKGAGFTNVVVDEDGTRRRVHLAQNIHGHWYLQLAFSPLVDFLGNPELELDNNRMLIRQARMPDGRTRDISIPLDGNGRMILDWPKEDYFEKYTHLSFHDFSLLEDLEAGLEYEARTLRSTVDFLFFGQFDPTLMRAHFILANLEGLFDAIHETRNVALEQTSEEYFDTLIEYRRESRDLIRDLLEIDPSTRVNELLPDLINFYGEFASFFEEQAGEIEFRMERLGINLYRYEEISAKIEGIVRDRFCILGRVDTGTTDIGSNPFHGIYVNVGTHGVVLDMILSEAFITSIAQHWRILFALVVVFAFFVLSAKLSPVPRAISGVLVTLAIALAAALLFRFTGIFFNPLLALFAMISSVILREIIAYAGSEREKQFIRKAFSTYVSDDVVKEIIEDPSRLQLGGTKRHMSAVFTDVKGFSTISEQLDPESLVSLLNRYLTFMSDAILEEKGTIDKYIGDAIVAFFGAPMPMEDHAIRACQSALAIRRIEAGLNKKIMEEKLSPMPLLTRIGINTGDMVAGNMGTENKMNYTIMGNTVNVAARLEGVNKQYGTWIIASDDTIRETGGRILTRKLDRVRVVGINEPVRLHELIEIGDFATPEQKNLVKLFHQALEIYESRKWKEAMEGFKESLSMEADGGGPSAKYIARCEKFIKTPPPDNWDGVANMTEK